MTDDADQPTFEGPRGGEPPFEPPSAAVDVTRCPACLSPVRSDQRYCLECGERLAIDELPQPPIGPSAFTDRNTSILMALAVALVIAGMGLSWVALRNSGSSNLAVTTAPDSISTDTVITDTVITDTIITDTAITDTVITDATDDWPVDQSGFAVIMASKDSATFTREDAQATADEATAAGVQMVGILDSSSFPSLNPGYWAVYSGPFSTLGEAKIAADEIRILGYPEAYAREVTP